MNDIPNQLWRHPGKRRYYRVQVMPDLFGELCLVRSWGSLDTARGNYKTEWVGSQAELERRLIQIGKERSRRGYQPVSLYLATLAEC